MLHSAAGRCGWLVAGAGRHRPCAARDLRRRRRGARRELHRLSARQRTRARVHRADPVRLRAAEHPTANGCGSTSRPARGSTSTGASSRRSARRSAATATAPGSTPPGAPGRCRSPTSAAAHAAPVPGRRCGNATPSQRHPGQAADRSTIRRTRSTPPHESCAKTWAPRRPAAPTTNTARPRATTTERAPTRTVSYAEEVMARAVQYGFTGTGSPAASSPPLAQPVSNGGCSASMFTPEAGRQLADRQGRRKPDRPGRKPARLQLHDLRAVRGVVLAVRRLGVAARRGAAPRLHRRLRVLRVALHLGARTRRPGAPADRDARAGRRRLLRHRAERKRARRDRRASPPGRARSSPSRATTPGT